MEAWKEASSLRKSGKQPSRVDLASYFASAIAANEEEDAAADGGSPISKVLPSTVPSILAFALLLDCHLDFR